jgi:HEPN domain-containing protein
MTAIPIGAKLQKLDDELASTGVPLRYRPLECFKKLYGAVGNERREELFDPLVQWYLAKYGDEAQWDGIIGRCPILIRGKVNLGLARFSAAAETVVNWRDQIEDLPESIAMSLTEAERNAISEKLMVANLELRTLYNLTIDDHCLPKFERGLVWRALHDLENAAVTLKHTGDTQTATVQAHEAAEKFLKAALRKSGSTKNLKNFGHDIPKVFGELVRAEPRYAWLSKPIENLQKLAPGMEMRYGPAPRSLEKAVGAFYAALHVCGVLANMWLFDMARGTSKSSFKEGRFYFNGAGLTFYCTRVQGETAILRRFHSSTFTGMQMMDIVMKTVQSAMYLEVTDTAEIERLKRKLVFHIRNRGKRVSPNEIGLKMINGPEGCYVTATFERQIVVRDK